MGENDSTVPSNMTKVTRTIELPTTPAPGNLAAPKRPPPMSGDRTSPQDRATKDGDKTAEGSEARKE